MLFELSMLLGLLEPFFAKEPDFISGSFVMVRASYAVRAIYALRASYAVRASYTDSASGAIGASYTVKANLFYRANFNNTNYKFKLAAQIALVKASYAVNCAVRAIL